jgi:trans-2,3-dihydro-3-hydroxyanthranilate isomerase
MTIPVALVDAFTTDPGKGNRAGVVTQTEGLDENAMKAAARSVAASETAFVFREGNALRFRYFTPEAEVLFCGHATVGAIHHLVEKGAIPPTGKIEARCGSGPLDLEIDADRTVWIDAGSKIEWWPPRVDDGDLLSRLGGDASMVNEKFLVLRAGSKIFIPLKNRRNLWYLRPDWDRVAELNMTLGVMGIYAFTQEVLEPGSVSHGRFFAPAVGIREDPVTGSAIVPLAHYLARFGILELPAAGGTVRARAEQGDAMGKPGRAELVVTGSPGKIERVRIGGKAVTVLEGQLRIN